MVEDECIAVGACCAQLLWIMRQIRDLGLNLKDVPIKCDNNSTINITKNPVQHSHTKHISSSSLYTRSCRKGHVILEFVSTYYQLVDSFTKALNEDRFNFIRQELGMLNLDAGIEVDSQRHVA